MFRDLRADEVDVRVSTVNEKGATLLLYKDARCDQAILDETVGSLNWQRHHTRDNANCIVSIWDDEKKQWIAKEDTGKESNTEAEKGLASDSFKRACFNWGIGRELYTAPFIWVPTKNLKKVQPGKNGKLQCLDKFTVAEMAVENKKITALVIVNQEIGRAVFSLGGTGWKEPPQTQQQQQPQPQPPMVEYITQEQYSIFHELFTNERIAKMCEIYRISSVDQLPATVAQQFIDKERARRAKDGAGN